MSTIESSPIVQNAETGASTEPELSVVDSKTPRLPLTAKQAALRTELWKQMDSIQWFIRDPEPRDLISLYKVPDLNEARSPQGMIADAIAAYDAYMKSFPANSQLQYVQLPFSREDIEHSLPALERVAERRRRIAEAKGQVHASVQRMAADATGS